MGLKLSKVFLSTRRQTGIFLVEVILALAIIGAAGLLIASYPNLLFLNSRSSRISIAKEIASKQIDYLRKKTYINLVATSSAAFDDSYLSSLPGSAAEFEVSSCPVQICNPAESIKQVKVRVSWTEKGKPELVEIVTLVSKGGVAY